MTWASGIRMVLVALVATVGMACSSTHAGERGAPATDATAGLWPSVPRPLSDSDLRLYARIFELQEGGDWSAADQEISNLQNRLLIGHVRFQRLMHPTDYRSSWEELRDWMAEHYDHPGAYRVFALAMRRKPREEPAPQEPQFGREYLGQLLGARPPEIDPRTRRQNEIRAEVRGFVRQGETARAQRLLSRPETAVTFDPAAVDEMRGQVAMSWYIRGEDRRAYDLASAAAARSGLEVSQPHWVAGLAAFRRGWYEHAAVHFVDYASAPGTNAWGVSAGAYWAARVSVVQQRPEEVERLLRLAAERTHTFYGILAARSLGEDIRLNWEQPLLTPGDVRRATEVSGGHRALALVQVGRVDLADEEMLHHIADGDLTLTRSLAALAEEIGLPRTAIHAAYRLMHFGALPRHRLIYPLPPWEPRDGFRLDRALIFAFMRQESLFNSRATSSAGARGLMQLMPATATYIAAEDTFDGRSRDLLYDPGLNLKLGQDYLEYLLAKDLIDDDLFRLAIAYNAGIGNLARWLRTVEYRGDPLLFIESIPVRETRLFIERVMANLWIYRNRLGQPTPSLDAVARGKWPKFERMDSERLMVVKDAEAG